MHTATLPDPKPFLRCAPEYAFISSSMVRELMRRGGRLRGFVPDAIVDQDPTVQAAVDRRIERLLDDTAARIVSGWCADGAVTAPIADFVFQCHDGAGWRDIPGAAARGNRDPYWSCTFQAIKTARVRLCITGTKGNVSRVWEVELYGPATDP